MNLWEETVDVLKENGKTFDDVVCVHCKDFRITNGDFERIARETNYDNGYGSPEVATDLIIRGDDWCLKRRNYDGSEWWEYEKLNYPSGLPTVKVNRLAAPLYGECGLRLINFEGE